MSTIDPSAWTKHSKAYDDPSGEPLTLPMVRSAFEAQWFEKLDKSIQKKKHNPLSVLLLACGTGAEVRVLCERFDESQMTILATDFSSGMVATTQEYIDRINKRNMVHTKVMDAMNIEAEDCTFDVIFLILGPMLMPDPNRVFQEIQRSLVPGGWSAYLTPNRMETHDVMIQARKEILTSANRFDQFKSFYNTEIMQSWGTPEKLESKLRFANFTEIESIATHSKLALQRGKGVDEMLDRLFENPGMLMFYTNDLSDEEVQQFKAKVRSAFHKNWPSSEAPIPASPYMIANAACGHKPTSAL